MSTIDTSREKDLAVHVDGTASPTSDNGTDRSIDAVPDSMKPMGLVKSLKTYKRAALICVLVAVGAFSDGYQVQMSGSIVALPGFINTFGDLQPDGEIAIEPQYLALWGCK